MGQVLLEHLGQSLRTAAGGHWRHLEVVLVPHTGGTTQVSGATGFIKPVKGTVNSSFCSLECLVFVFVKLQGNSSIFNSFCFKLFFGEIACWTSSPGTGVAKIRIEFWISLVMCKNAIVNKRERSCGLVIRPWYCSAQIKSPVSLPVKHCKEGTSSR